MPDGGRAHAGVDADEEDAQAGADAIAEDRHTRM
jgi:hypothetical protein